MPNFGNTLRNAFDKSLFSKKSYQAAIDDENGAYRIEIIPNNSKGDIGLIGVMSEAISISMDPEWDTLNLSSIVSNFPTVENIFNLAVAPMAAAGVSLNNSGLVTEKFYVKGGYLNIEPTFKVVNWNDDGAPLQAALLLLNLCTPKKTAFSTSLGEIYEKLKGLLNESSGKSNGLVNLFVEKLEGVITDGENLIKKGVNRLPKELKDPTLTGAQAISTGEYMLTNSPPSVFVRVGNYFGHPEMIIENLSIEFSKQMTKTGPLFAEFKTSLSSKTMPVLAGEDKYSVGLKLRKDMIEFQIDNESRSSTGVSNFT